ncbi:MAG: hypothetical protein HFH03_12050 [Dorea sp.]|jgi:hypothetical protein|nr:hypothetical protein [Dorea sp.]
MKKEVFMLLICSLMFVICSTTTVKAAEKIEEELVLSEYIYDGMTEQELGTFDVYNKSNIQLMDNYREYDRYIVTNQGITKKWSWLSKPYFITSVARGMTKTREETVSATISGAISGTYPSAAKSGICKKAGLNSSLKKTVKKTISVTGPPSNSKYSSRDYYYKQGRHTYKFKVVREHRSNWDGVLWKKTYYVNVGIPAIKNYSVDEK